jgi:hypothetical protein
VTHRGPVVTAIVVVGGLVGFMTANSAGALVATKAADQKVEVPSASEAAANAQGSQAKPGKSEQDAPKAPRKPDTPAKPPAPTFPQEAMYAGDATGSNLAMAIAVKGDQASGYLCDGSAVEDWLKGTVDDGKLEATSKEGGSKVTAELKGKRLVGSVTFHGQTRPFSIAPADSPAGLYRAKNGQTTIGWIILPNGQQVGIKNVGGDEAPAPMLDPEVGYVTVDGQRIDAQQIEGDSGWG